MIHNCEVCSQSNVDLIGSEKYILTKRNKSWLIYVETSTHFTFPKRFFCLCLHNAKKPDTLHAQLT